MNIHIDENYFAESKAYRKLQDELEKYAIEKIDGGSALISGHRGAGKTTLVKMAITSLEDKLVSRYGYRRKPLMIPLHGPDLLNIARSLHANGEKNESAVNGDVKKAPVDTKGVDATGQQEIDKAAGEKGGAEASSSDVKKAPGNGKVVDAGSKQVIGKQASEQNGAEALSYEDKLIKNVLEHLTVSLYRAVANEFFKCFRKKLQQRAPGADYNELIGLLRLELDESPDLSTLREIWKKAGFLNEGVLFEGIVLRTVREGQDYDQGTEYFDQQDPEYERLSRPLTDQGVQEIVLLSSAAQAFRTISGSVNDEKNLTRDNENEATRSTQYSVVAKEIINAVLGIISGAAVGLGIYSLPGESSGIKMLLSSLGGVVAAILANFSFTRTSKSTVKRKVSKQYKFIRNTNISSLNREIPNLIKRMREIGLAPIFVVDELDKVIVHPFTPFGELISYLKKLVSENSFFCFLTDRNYFDYITGIYQGSSYPKQYTYFTHRFFVNYSPRDLHTYLDKCLGLYAQSIREKETVVEAFLLKYLLLNRANLHAIDLRREILKWSVSREITINGLRSRDAFRFPIMIQLGIEYIMEGEYLTERFEQDPYFSQLMNDALYYPVRSWLSGEEVLDLSFAKFGNYLRERMESGAPEVPQSDLNLLHARIKKLVDLLANPDKLVGALKEAPPSTIQEYSTRYHGIWEEIIQTIPLQDPGIPLNYLLLMPDKDENLYHWKFEYFGGALGEPIPDQEKISLKIELLNQIDSAVKELTANEINLGQLASNQVIHATPDWGYLQTSCIKNLKKFIENKDEYGDLKSDFRNLNEYYSNLLKRGPMLVKTFILAYYVKSVNNEFAWKDIFKAIGTGMHIRMGENASNIDRVLLGLGLSGDLLQDFSKMTDPQDWVARFKSTVTSQKFTFIETLETIKLRWWPTWRQRLLNHVIKGTTEVELNVDDLICITGNYNYAGDFGRDISKIQPPTWSTSLIEELKREDQYKSLPSPDTAKQEAPERILNDRNWIVIPALIKLGFTSVDFTRISGIDNDWKGAIQKSISSAGGAVDKFIIIISDSKFSPLVTGTKFPALFFEYQNWVANKEVIIKVVNMMKINYPTPILLVDGSIKDIMALTEDLGNSLLLPKDNTLLLLAPNATSGNSTYKEIREIKEIENLVADQAFTSNITNVVAEKSGNENIIK